MARTLVEAAITTRNARRALTLGVHWRGLDADIHLGYRKNKRGGHWLVRWYAGEGRYSQTTIGVADDLITEGNLSFDAASKAARKEVVAARDAAAALQRGIPITIRTAVDEYVAVRNRRASIQAGREVKSDAHTRMKRAVLNKAELADVELRALTEDQLRGWRDDLSRCQKHTTVKRTSGDLRAALNSAYASHRKQLPPGFSETVRLGLRAAEDGLPVESAARSNQILTDEETRRLLASIYACDMDGDFARLVVVLAATGARFCQVARMQVEDVQIEQRRLFVPTSFKGQRRAAALIKVSVGEDVVEALRPVVEGRAPADPLLERWRHRQIGPTTWVRESRGPWRTPSEMLRPWRRAVEKAGLPKAIPYALRHSSIVRALRIGLPVRLVAGLHDTSVAMIERHYARWITESLDELASRAVIPLLPEAGEARLRLCDL